MYSYLAVWSCPRGLITPQHDEGRVKGQGIEGGPLAAYGTNQSSLFGECVYGGYTAIYFSMSAGSFTGTLGAGKTVDDVVIA